MGQTANGYVISSTEFESGYSIKDYNYVGTQIDKGETIVVDVFFSMDSG